MELLSSLLVLAAAAGWGALVAPGDEPRTPARILIETCVGIALLSEAVLLLGSAGLLYRHVVLGVAFGVAAAGWVRGARRRLAIHFSFPRGARLEIALLALAGVATVWRTLEEDGGADLYHCFLPKAFLLQHATAVFPANLEATLSMGLEMLNVVAYCFGTGTQPAILSASFFVLACWGLWILLRRHSLAAAVLGTACLAGTPLLARSAGTSHTETGQVLLAVAVLASGLDAIDRGGTRRLVETGFLAGFLAVTKDSSVLLPGLPAAVLLAAAWLRRRTRFGAAAWAAALAAVVVSAGPWVLRKWLATGDPAYPLLVREFPVRDDFRDAALVFSTFNHRPDPAAALSGVKDVLRDDGFELALGLGAPLLLLVKPLRRRCGPILLAALAAAAACALLLGGARVIRYAGPAMPFFALAVGALLGAGLEEPAALPAGRRRALLAVGSLGLLVRYPLAVAHMYPRPSELVSPVPWTFSARRDREARRAPAIASMVAANRTLGPGDTLLVASEQKHFEYLDVPFVPPPMFLSDPRGWFLSRGAVWRGRPLTWALVYPIPDSWDRELQSPGRLVRFGPHAAGSSDR